LRLHKRNPIRMLVMDMTDGAQLASWCSDELGIPVMDRGADPVVPGDGLRAVHGGFA
jgi:hypothetical protein